MIKRIFRIWWGYLILEIRGNALAKFINQINGMGITIWNLQRIRYDYYQASIYIDDFNKLHSLVRKRKCQVRIVEKRGIPFFLKKVKKRLFLLLGLILFLSIFYYGSLFLWFFEIKGLNNIDEQKIMEVLKAQGIKRGILKEKIDTDLLEDILIKEISGISWVNIKWSGTQLSIDIVEKRVVVSPEKGEIFAAKDGVIKELIVLKGQAAVKEGDTVVKGQVLIVPGNGEEEARGLVKADVWYDAYGEAVSYKEKILKTGRMKTFWGLKIGSVSWWLSKIDPSYQQYKRKRELKKLLIWRNIALPIELIKEEHIEITLLRENRSTQLTLFQAKEKAFTDVLKSLASDSIIEDVIYKIIEMEDKNQIKVRLLMKVEENIALKEDSSGRN